LSRLSTNVSTVVLVLLSLLMVLARSPVQVGGVLSHDPPPVVGVWSNLCQSFNISLTNAGCGSLGVGTTISVQINVTNAALNSINGYEFFLYYDHAFLNATGVDPATGTIFSNPSVITSDFTPLGTAHVAAVCLACTNTSTNGAMVNINFKILAVGVSPLTLAVGMVSSGFAQSFTELTTPGGGALAPTTADGYFKNEPVKLGPVARFSFSPASPRPGKLVTFYANASYDPDAAPGLPNNGISLYIWDFGGASSQSATSGSPTDTLRLGSVYGNFSIRLTVVDADNTFEGMKTELLTVSQNPFHDLIAQTIGATPNPAKVGDKVTVSSSVFNNGTFPENFNLTLSYGTPGTVFGTRTNQSIAIGATSSFSITLDTSSFTPGNFYTLTANVTVLPSLNNTKGIDNLLSNNMKTTVLNMEGAASSASNLLLIVGVAVGAVAVVSAATLLLRRRRRASASD
jgi:cohesin domain-containing protein